MTPRTEVDSSGIRDQLFLLGTFASPARIASLLIPRVTALAPGSENTVETLARAKQLVQWWRWNSDHKPLKLIREFDQRMPADEGGLMTRHEILGRLFTPEDFVYAFDDIAADLAGCRNQIPTAVAAFGVSVRQELNAQNSDDPSQLFSERQRLSLVQSTGQIFHDPYVLDRDRVLLAQATVLAHPLTDKFRLPDQILLTSLDLADEERVGRLTSDELASRLAALILYRHFPTADALQAAIRNHQNNWLRHQNYEQTDPNEEFCYSLARMIPLSYTTNQPDRRDIPHMRVLAEVTADLMAGLFTQENLLQYIHKYDKGDGKPALKLSEDETNEVSRLVRAYRIKIVESEPHAEGILNESERAQIRKILHPFLLSLPREAAVDVATIIMSITPTDAEREIDVAVCDPLLGDDGNLGLRAQAIIQRRLQDKQVHTLMHMERRLSGAPLSAQYRTWWSRVARLFEPQLRSYKNLNTTVARLANLGNELDIDNVSLAHFSQLASSMLIHLNWPPKLKTDQGIGYLIVANSSDAAYNILSACLNLDSRSINTLAPLVFVVRDLNRINPMLISDWRIQNHLEKIAQSLDRTTDDNGQHLTEDPMSQYALLINSTRDAIRTLLLPPEPSVPVTFTS